MNASLLCVNCGLAPPPHRRKWDSCKLCARRNLPATYYCGDACMEAHWPKHRAWHKEQKEGAEEMRASILAEADRSEAEHAAQRAEETGDEYDGRFAAALALMAEEDHHAAAKAWRKIIKLLPEQPEAYWNLGVALDRSSRPVEAVQMYLKAMELNEDDTEDWAESVAAAFLTLKLDDCREVPKPEWWNDEALKALSARVVAAAPGRDACGMRALVLSGEATVHSRSWNAVPRPSGELKEAATWFRRAARVACLPSAKLIYEENARFCDALADRLLTKEEAEAEVARAAAAEARKVAEAKAFAAAEELLADEEKEKQAAATATIKAGKAKQGKGQKGKGKGKR